jgi:hypothetical protein
MAGMKYLDKAELTSPTSVVPSPGSTPDSDSDADVPDASSSTSPPQERVNAADPPPEPRPSFQKMPILEPPHVAAQFAALRSLRDETERQFDRFRVISQNTENPILKKLYQETYRDVKTLRNRGLIYYRDLLEHDPYPLKTLKQTFAFVSLSYAISRLLVRAGRMQHHDVLSGIGAWRHCIMDDGERDAFDILAANLWPEVGNAGQYQNSLQDIMTGSLPYLDASATGYQISTGELPFNPVDPVGDALLQEFQSEYSISLANYTREAFDFALLSDSNQYMGQSGDPGPSIRVTQSSVAQDAHSDLYLPGPSQDSAASDQDSPGEGSGAEGVTRLTDTMVFKAVRIFFHECTELIQIFMGRGHISKPEAWYGGEQEEQKLFRKSAHEHFFRPRYQLQRFPCAEFTALLSVAQLFVKWGYLKDFDGIKHYLMLIAPVSQSA